MNDLYRDFIERVIAAAKQAHFQPAIGSRELRLQGFHGGGHIVRKPNFSCWWLNDLAAMVMKSRPHPVPYGLVPPTSMPRVLHAIRYRFRLYRQEGMGLRKSLAISTEG